MKDIIKNPFFYYVVVPAVLALWPLWLGVAAIPSAKYRWEQEKKQYLKAQELFAEIVQLDPERLKIVDGNEKSSEFGYAMAVEQAARSCGITPDNYKLSSGVAMKVGGQEVQAADVTLRTVDITRFARFLDTIQFRWPNLQCTQLKLTKQKGERDLWKADLKFKYFK